MKKRTLFVSIALFFAVTATAQQFSTKDFVDALPFPLSEKAKMAFAVRAQEENLSMEQARTLMWQLLSEGETLMPEKDKQEMANTSSLHPA